MKYLNVAQKNTAAETIAGLLSDGAAQQRDGLLYDNKIYEFDAKVEGEYSRMVMTSVSGHFMEYAFVSKGRFWEKGVDPEELFDAPLGKELKNNNARKIAETLEREIKDCQGLILWTNCNREGENIAFDIINICEAIEPNIIVKRAIFSDITKASLQHALDGLSKPNKNQSEAVNVRKQIDLRTGAAFTRYQSFRYQKMFPDKFKKDEPIKYGNCMFPTLGFVVRRFLEVGKYIPPTFWSIKVLHTIDDLTVEFISRRFDQLLCERFFASCQQNPNAVVQNIVQNQENKERPFPLNTVELEKLGSRELKIAAVDVMEIAENLFNKGIISYPKTEANIFPKDLNLEYLVGIHTTDPNWGPFASKVLEWGVQPNNGTSTDPTHPPIHPKIYTNNLRGNENRVYDLIVRHFLACVSRNAQGTATTVNINIFNEEFIATGLYIEEKNYLEVYPFDRWEAKKLHDYNIYKQFTPTEILMPEETTILPKMLTEAGLISLMVENRIGTDGTRVGHINRIKTIGYANQIEEKYLLPTPLGIGLVEGYDAIDVGLAHPELRAELEADLTEICDGLADPVEVLKDQIDTYKDLYCKVKENVEKIDKALASRLITNINKRRSSTSELKDSKLAKF